MAGFNERLATADQSLKHARCLPLLQVCDDSTRDEVKRRIDAKVAEMVARGHNCMVTRRPSNKGYKAGNMINGMDTLAEVRNGCGGAWLVGGGGGRWGPRVRMGEHTVERTRDKPAAQNGCCWAPGAPP